MTTQKTIVWVTDDTYVDHDIDVVPLVSSEYTIHWIILFAVKNNRYTEDGIRLETANHPNLHLHFIYSACRKRNIKNINYYLQILDIAKSIKVDVFHLDIGVDNPWAIPMFLKLPREKSIIVLHQGIPHEGMKHRWLCNLIRKIEFKRLNYVKMFSKSQADIFRMSFPSHTVFEFNLPLIGFGKPTNKRPDRDNIRFLSFGTLNYAKNVDLLIDAACLLYKKGIRGFKVIIKGGCKDWSWYQQRIEYPEIFELDIRMVNNSEIPNLFNGVHYFVQPYRVVSQSGPLKIAFNYNLPVIASDLPGFRDEIKDGVNGFCFKKGDVNDLARVMKECIVQNKEEYETLRKNMDEYTKMHYSSGVVLEKYHEMFESVIQNSKKYGV